nr:FAD-binding oxidoreductase [Streptomyces sp. SKN60]
MFFQTAFAVRPDRLVSATGPEDVRAAVRYAAEHGLSVTVTSTGHGLGGPVEGGVLIDTRAMDGVEVDPVARTARIGAGARWGQVVEAAAPHGLAPLNGSSPGVGAVGYLLGGGLGILGRTHGWAADRVRAVDLVTADGAVRRLVPGDAAFGALLGGGAVHRFGVVTEVTVDLVPVARLYGGSIAFDGAAVDPAGLLRGYVRWAEGLPAALTSSLAALVHPDAPALPPRLRGRYVLSVRVAFTGDAVEGERLVAPLRALGPALSDSLRELPYSESPSIHADPDFPHAYWGDGILLDTADVDALVEVLRLTGPEAGRMAVVQLNHLGGALAAEGPASVPYREAGWLVRALYPLDEAGAAPVRELHARVEAALAPRTLGRAVNFVFGDRERTEGLYDPETAKRLAAVKSELDPANLFG